MATRARATALLTVASVRAFPAGAFAADPTQADYDACNREPQAGGDTPAASPTTGGPSGGSRPRP